MTIDNHNLDDRLFIDHQYQSINYHRLSSIIDFTDWLRPAVSVRALKTRSKPVVITGEKGSALYCAVDDV